MVRHGVYPWHHTDVAHRRDGSHAPSRDQRYRGGTRPGTESIHAAGVVHRDLKPSNVMLSPTGPRIIDFGIADLTYATQLTRRGRS